jgi:hypothetical protein
MDTGCEMRDPAQMSDVTVKEVLTEAIRYWEPRRIAYNAILAVVVTAVFALNWPGSGGRVNADLAQGLFILAVLANVAYCAAYVIDIAAQFSAFRPTWQRYRWMLFGIGIIFAAIFARFFFTGMFGPAA